MEPNKCISEASAALGRQLTDDEAISLFTEVQKKIKEAGATAGPFDEAIRAAGEKYAKEVSKAARIEKRNAAIALKLRIETMDFVKTQFANDYAGGLEAALVGVNKAALGSRFSAAAQQNALAKNYLSGLVYDLEKANVLKLLTNKQSDLEITNALWSINNPAAPAYTGPVEIKKLADIIYKWQEVTRIDSNNAGADIGKLAGYIVRQSHDNVKIRAASREQWIDDIQKELDFTITFGPGENAREILGKMYEGFSNGIHLKASENITGFKGGTANLAKKVSAERVLHFKNANAWYNYHSKYGVGSISDAIIRQMNVAAQNVSLMRTLGPNPRDNYNRIVAMLEAGLKNDPEQLKKFQQATSKNGFLERRFAEIDGSVTIPNHDLMAEISSGIRGVQAMSKLGAAVVSSITDIPAVMTELRYQGFDMTEAMYESIAGLIKGQNRANLADIDAGLGIVFDSVIGRISSRFEAGDNLPGVMSKMQQLFFKLNGLTWWTDTLRATSTRLMSHFAARNKNLPFDKLNPDTSRVYGLYGIDAEKWDMMRQTVTKGADGREYLLAREIRNLPDNIFVSYLEARNMKASDTAIASLKDEVESQWMTYFDDRASYAVLEPDARTKAVMNQGHAPGTPTGELLRFIGQFKGFPIAFVQKVMGREVYGRGADPSAGLIAALKNGNGEAMGLAQVILWSTIFGYGAMTAKEIIKGKMPRKPETAEEYAKLIQASMLQGGGAGIFGDFLFGEMTNRYGAGPISSLLGPTFATADSIADLYGRAKKGDDVAAATVKLIISNTPGANIFYARAMLDYLVIYRVQEALNPGYLKRMEDRVKKEQNQTFFVPPSQVIQ